MSAWSPPSGYQRDVMQNITLIAGRVEDQLGGLALADLVGGVGHHRVFAALGRQIETPRPERVGAEILTQTRSRPGLAAVGRHLHRTDTVAAVPGHAADRDLAGFHLRAVAMTGNQ